MAIIFQEGGRLVSSLLTLRTPKIKIAPQPEPEPIRPPPQMETKASSVDAGCVPCALGHFGTCKAGLSEAMRFARSEGIESSEVIARMNDCLDELNQMERSDLTEEKIKSLPEWEKEIAERVLLSSRQTRHAIEGITTVKQLEAVTASTQTIRKEIGQDYFREKIARMSPEEKARLKDRVDAEMRKQSQEANIEQEA